MLHTMIHPPVHCRSLIWRRELNRYGYTSKILKQHNTEVERCKAFLMQHNTSSKEPSQNFTRLLRGGRVILRAEEAAEWLIKEILCFDSLLGIVVLVWPIFHWLNV